jgi:hypothetical protein
LGSREETEPTFTLQSFRTEEERRFSFEAGEYRSENILSARASAPAFPDLMALFQRAVHPLMLETPADS